MAYIKVPASQQSSIKSVSGAQQHSTANFSHAAAAAGGGNLGEFSPEGCIATLTDFGDSVGSCCWSLANESPWVFAAVSWNGKVLVDTVSQQIVQNILLDCQTDE
jgi:hypothetical protein